MSSYFKVFYALNPFNTLIKKYLRQCPHYPLRHSHSKHSVNSHQASSLVEDAPRRDPSVPSSIVKEQFKQLPSMPPCISSLAPDSWLLTHIVRCAVDPAKVENENLLKVKRNCNEKQKCQMSGVALACSALAPRDMERESHLQRMHRQAFGWSI